MQSILIGIVAFSLIAKVVIHAHLDWKHNRFEGLRPATMQPISYFFPYVRNVEPAFEKEKKACNLLYIVLIISIILTFVYSFFAGTKL